MIKTDEITAFVAVMRSESISQAAEALQLTQPAITRRLQNLEESLGATLFDRNTKPLKPTAIGIKVYEQSCVILRELRALTELTGQDAEPTGLLRLGIPQTLGDLLLLDVLQSVRDAYPALQTRILNGWGTALLEKLEHGELDAVCALFPTGKRFPEGVVAESLAETQLLVVAARGRLRHRSTRLAECNELGWVLNPDGCGFRAGLQHALVDQGMTLRLNMEIYGSELQLGLVAGGAGLGLVPAPFLESSQYRHQLEVIHALDFHPSINLWLVHPRFVGNLKEPIRQIGQLMAGHLLEPR